MYEDESLERSDFAEGVQSCMERCPPNFAPRKEEQPWRT